jgi:hypothetical protein
VIESKEIIKEPEIKIKKPKIKEPKKIPRSKFKELYSQGYSDGAIAKICDCRRHDVYVWRTETNRVSNYNPAELKTIIVKLERDGKIRANISLNSHFLKMLGWRADDMLKLSMEDGVLQVCKVPTARK